MLDRDRILAKLDELDGYVRELESVAPTTIVEYRQVEKKRACERLVQIAVEAVIDICHLFVAGLRLGLPGGDEDVLAKLEDAGILSAGALGSVRKMKGCRNILVHEYGRVDDEIVFNIVVTRLRDLDGFKREVREALKRF